MRHHKSEIEILIADDHRMFRQGLKSLIEKESNYTVIAEASNGKQAVELCRSHSPRLVLMDISMPELTGIEATKQILQELPDTKIVALSMHADQRFVVEALKAGAAGYLLKDSAVEELLRAMAVILKGHTYLSPSITDLLVKDYIRQLDTPQAASSYTRLTTRELQVLRQVADGRSTKEIAHALDVSVKTVETYRQQIMEKLQLHSVAELTKYAIRQGLTSV